MRRITGVEYNLVRLFMIINVWWIGTKAYGHPLKSFQVVAAMLKRIDRMFDGKMFVRAFKINKKYVLHAYHPAWPSRAFNSFFISRLHEIEPISKNHTSLRRLFVAITKQCPLQCEHCSEAETLYQQDILSYDELKDRIESFVHRGVSQLVYSGGEPLSRFHDLEKLVSYFQKDCDQWIYTSGYGLTAHKAKTLKRAGLRGAAISLDHHLEDYHNDFRGSDKSFSWVLEALRNFNDAGIMTALNVCPTKRYITSFDFEDYMKLAKKLQVPIINIIEPRSVGNYSGKNVELDWEHKDLLLRICYKYNFNKALRDFPTVVYPAVFGKSLPCGGGRSYLFLDFDGKVYPCPFCKVHPVADVSAQENFCLIR